MQPRSKILVVDDNRMNTLIVEEILSEDYQLASATSGKQAIELARQFLPDLILLDIVMPSLDGFETCRQLRADPELCHVKIILVSAKTEIADRLRGYEVGADDYLTKPLDADELIAKVKVFLRLKFVEELDHLKKDILTLLNHETRTPLTGIVGSLQVLGLGVPMSDEDRKEMIDGALQNCDRLQSLLEKSMLLCEMQSGSVPMNCGYIPLDSLVQDAVANLQEFAEEKHVGFNIQSQEEIQVYGDAVHLQMLLRALLHNAVRFSPENDEVILEAVVEEGRLTLAVIDHGPGISQTLLPCVFDPFTPSDIEHHSVGQGLSLAISQEIVRQLEGEIGVYSQPGRETRFYVSLPAPDSTPSARCSVESSCVSSNGLLR